MASSGAWRASASVSIKLNSSNNNSNHSQRQFSGHEVRDGDHHQRNAIKTNATHEHQRQHDSSATTDQTPQQQHQQQHQQQQQQHSSPANEKLLLEKLRSLERKIAEYEFELKEAKEIVEFVTLERDVIVDALRDAEESLARERLVWDTERRDYQQTLDTLNAKYQRNHKVWLDNDRKATQEIKALDDIVDHVIRTIESLPFNMRHYPSVQQMLALVRGETSLSAINASSGSVANSNNNNHNHN